MARRRAAREEPRTRPGRSASPRCRSDKRGEFARRINGDLPLGLGDAVRGAKEKLAAEPKDIATRIASENALDVLTAAVPEMVGGSADLTGSNNTRAKAHDGDVGGRLCRHASSTTASASTAWRPR